MNRRDKELMEHYDAKFALSSQHAWDRTLEKYGTKDFFGSTAEHPMSEQHEERAKEQTAEGFPTDQPLEESREDVTLENYLKHQPREEVKEKTPHAEHQLKINEIVEGMEGISTVGKVVSIGERKLVKTKYGETYVATAVLSDNIASVLLDLWRNQIEKVSAGDRIGIRNGISRMYGNEIHIFVPSAGVIERRAE
jgi:hypothetical protein